ncbi:MAG: universal stress protein [Prolixibacteraceae bacterium]|nr:universal stress protein [Prolixibacteraceae bacterium]
MKKLAFLINEIDKSKELIRFAALLANDLKAKVHVWYIQNPQVVGVHDYMGMPEASISNEHELFQKIADDIKLKVNGFIKEIKAEQSDIPKIKFKSDNGIASAILKEKVEKGKYDMVLLQGDDEQGLWFNNSVVMDIVRDVPCPVYIIPADAHYQPIKKIVYATDYSKEDIKTLKRISKLLKSFKPEILALHISNDNEFKENLKSEGFAKMLNKKTGNNKVSVKVIADKEEEDAVKSLVSEAEKAKTNLIVVLKENRNFFERLFQSSFTAKLIKKTQLPVMVFHKKEE